ncbi:hypothetical protein DFH94DRAFT_191598 [Russula ochroleuca]|uniref:Uncharacterized protein n=1 Tax=Russula ochroleuca TaxID=152965 RepID=A0A9P5MPN3_9AGAM|nr:hypothetical protein DFH94DRAFT_191598 [Russula ochroleuca]
MTDRRPRRQPRHSRLPHTSTINAHARHSHSPIRRHLSNADFPKPNNMPAVSQLSEWPLRASEPISARRELPMNDRNLNSDAILYRPQSPSITPHTSHPPLRTPPSLTHAPPRSPPPNGPDISEDSEPAEETSKVCNAVFGLMQGKTCRFSRQGFRRIKASQMVPKRPWRPSKMYKVKNELHQYRRECLELE